MRVVEAEGAGLHLAEADVAVDAGELLGEEQVVAVDDVHEHRPAGELERGLDGVGHAALFEALVNDQAVDDDLDVVPLGLLERDVLGQVAGLAVDADADEPRSPGVLEDLLVLALATPHHRSQNLDSRAVGQVDDGVDHLLDGLALDGAAAGVAVRMTHSGEEEAQVVVDLRDGADGGARVAGDALLVDGDGGREALDVVDLRLVHAAEELPRVGGQRLDVAALALGVDRVEGEGALA